MAAGRLPPPARAGLAHLAGAGLGSPAPAALPVAFTTGGSFRCADL